MVNWRRHKPTDPLSRPKVVHCAAPPAVVDTGAGSGAVSGAGSGEGAVPVAGAAIGTGAPVIEEETVDDEWQRWLEEVVGGGG